MKGLFHKKEVNPSYNKVYMKRKSTHKNKSQKKGNFQGRRRPKGKSAIRGKFPKKDKPRLTELLPTNWSPKGEAELKKGKIRFLLWGGIPNEKGRYRMVHRGQNQSIKH